MPTRRDRLVVLLAAGSALLLTLPEYGGLSPVGVRTLAAAWFVAVLWVTGAVPLPAAAVTVPPLLVAAGAADLPTALSGFADPVVFLMLSGFVLAAALRRHGIDRRVAHRILVAAGGTPRRLVFGLMVAAASLSMVVSNTATAAMLAPVALGLAREVAPEDGNLRVAALLGVAYGASIGGVGTLVGTPPNAVVAGQLSTLLGYRITFLGWLAVGIPVVVVALPVAWLLLVRVYPPVAADTSTARERARDSLREAGALAPDARRTVVVFGATVALWVLGGLGFVFVGVLPPNVHATLFGGAGSTGVLDYVVVGMLAIPTLVVSGCLPVEEAFDIDWGSLLLFGGGISLAEGLGRAGVVEWVAGGVVRALGGVSLPVLLGVIVLLAVLLSELASNTATAAMLAPFLVGIGPGFAGAFGGDATAAAVTLAITGGVASSFGFALPVATPPNAIVFGTEGVSRREMLHAGARLDLLLGLLLVGLVLVLSRTVWPAVLA